MTWRTEDVDYTAMDIKVEPVNRRIAIAFTAQDDDDGIQHRPGELVMTPSEAQALAIDLLRCVAARMKVGE